MTEFSTSDSSSAHCSSQWLQVLYQWLRILPTVPPTPRDSVVEEVIGDLIFILIHPFLFRKTPPAEIWQLQTHRTCDPTVSIIFTLTVSRVSFRFCQYYLLFCYSVWCILSLLSVLSVTVSSVLWGGQYYLLLCLVYCGVVSIICYCVQCIVGGKYYLLLCPVYCGVVTIICYCVQCIVGW